MINRVFVTGDTHGNFDRIKKWCEDKKDLTVEDVLIVLGDAGINYFKNSRDIALKEFISKLPITLVCVHGNHEERPENCEGYYLEYVDELGCNCWVEDGYPNILFPQNGKMVINGEKFLIIGGAYSVDKHIRLLYGWNWFESEQLTDSEMDQIREVIKQDSDYDYVLTHTCPLKFEPVHLFLRGVDQSKVDKRMERFLDEIEESIAYKKWLYGHFHSDEVINDKAKLFFNGIEQII